MTSACGVLTPRAVRETPAEVVLAMVAWARQVAPHRPRRWLAWTLTSVCADKPRRGVTPAQELQGEKVFICLVSWEGVGAAGAAQKVGESQPWASVGVEIDASDWVSINQERMKQDYTLYKHTELCEKHLCWESRTITAASWHQCPGTRLRQEPQRCPRFSLPTCVLRPCLWKQWDAWSHYGGCGAARIPGHQRPALGSCHSTASRWGGTLLSMSPTGDMAPSRTPGRQV